MQARFSACDLLEASQREQDDIIAQAKKQAAQH